MGEETAASDALLAGWDELDPTLAADGPTPLSEADLRTFFDGRSPDWAVATAPGYQVPRRKVVAEAVASLRSPVTPAMVLLLGAGGEGRSTALRQIAVDLVGAGHRVLFRVPGTPLDGDAIAALPPASTGWILASDDADEIAWDLEPVIERLVKEGRRDIHWLLTARDKDWDAEFRSAGRSVEPQWDRHVEVWPRRMARAQALPLTEEDVNGIVVAWESADSLGDLAAVAADERAAALLETAQARPGQSFSGGTFLGAALDRRLGADGLSAHVRAVMERLAADDRALVDAFMYAAAADAVGIDGVDLRVVAGLVGFDPDRRREIRDRLADAGVATGGREVLRPRHHAIATAATLLADAGVADVDLEQIFRSLVRGTGETGKTTRPLVSDGAIMTVSPALADRLQRMGVPPERATRIACATADEAQQTLSDLLVFIISRARTYLNVGRADEGSAILRAAIPGALQREDWERVGRNYLYEMNLCEGQVGRQAESVLLAGLSVSDGHGLGPITTMDAQLGMTSLGTAVSAMDPAADRDERFTLLLRASAHLSRFVTPKWDQPARLRFIGFDKAADELNLPACSSPVAIGWLADAVVLASEVATGDDLAALLVSLFPDGGRPGFKVLEKALATR
ncbi:MAG: hypothetical protein QOJ69_29 [Actinomycetota bacterium]|nr:hypothetical protein [Actinomycetota bacterium]